MEKQEKEIIRMMRPVRLTEAADGMEADLIVGALKEQGLAAYKRPLESGGIMNTYMGFSIFGAEILVDEEDFAAARTLLDEISFVSSNLPDAEAAEEEEEEDDDDDDFSAESADSTGRQVFRILVFVFIAGLALWAVSVIGSLLYGLIITG